MKPGPASASQALQNAQQAVQRGDRPSARRWAEMAAALAPELEEPWLILAALASPRSSVSYLERALRINPGSQRAQEGMRWAVKRLRQEGEPRSRPQDETQPRRPLPDRWTRDRATRPVQVGTSHPAASSTASALPPLPVTLPLTPPPGDSPQRLLTKYRRSFTSLLLVVVCLAIVWAVWPGNALPALAFLRQNILPQSSPTAPGAPADVAKPTYTPSATATFTPTATYTPTATFTLLTATSTDTPIPTSTFTPWPTNTRLPQPTLDQYSFPGDLSGGTGERWIDVDLSQQRLYAYEGNTLVASFLVSTGVWQYPTVVGKFHIYVKYLYADMAGVGYYLPNVPYTMYFYKGYSIHGTYWHNNFGHPMSHGCINMYTPDAAWMFNWASVGTLVNIHY